MTSFVREILSSAGRLDSKEDLRSATERVEKNLGELKAGMRMEVERHYSKFASAALHSAYPEASSHVARLKVALDEVNTLQNTLRVHIGPEVKQASGEMEDLRRQLDQLRETVAAATRIKEAYVCMEEANSLVNDGKFLEAAEKLRQVSESVNEADDDGDEAAAFAAVREEHATAMEIILEEMGKKWDASVRLEEEKKECGVVVKISTTRVSEQLARAMYQADMLSLRLGKFAHFFISQAFKPIVTDSRIEVTKSPMGEILITCSNKDAFEKCPVPEKVFQNLELLFESLSRSMDVSATSNGETLIQLLGETISEQITSIVVDFCLSPALPNSQEDLPRFEALLNIAQTFDENLKTAGFLRVNQMQLSDYAKNIEATFADRRVACILGKARETMKEALHNVTYVDATTTMNDEQAKSEFSLPSDAELSRAVPELEGLSLPEGVVVDESLFRFPKCQVSQHVVKIMDTVHSALREACSSSGYLASRLIHAARLIFELYLDVLPVHHRDALAQFPQQSALALTNCMFLSYQCVTLGMSYKALLPDDLGRRFFSFADMVVKLRETGLHIFQKQLLSQRDQLMTILKEFTSKLSGDTTLPPNSERALRQVVHHLHHLKKVWQHVLPPNIYLRAIGVIVNSVVETMADKVIALEDIAADAAIQISNVFKAFLEKAPGVFVMDGNDDTSVHDVARFVKSWGRFRELILVLNASLREIEERWSGGKGPLAADFSVEEMKQLIRALFQNTERRATILARIKSD